MPPEIEAEPPPSTSQIVKERLAEIMCGVVADEIVPPTELEFINNYDDDNICLKELAHKGTENEFMKTFQGDGWSDDTMLCHTANIHGNKDRFITDNLDPNMYMSREISMSPLVRYEKEESDTDCDSEIEQQFRTCMANENKNNNMIDVRILKATDKDSNLYFQLMDSGANKGLTKYRYLLRDYRRIKKIPVSGISENGAACFIIGVGYMDIETDDGSFIRCKMYHAPTCSVTVISPNAIVRGSRGAYTSWIQTSHVVDGMASINFFN